ncbi:MAG: helix-turn-helix domain-containing protein [Chryseotalea sp.]
MAISFFPLSPLQNAFATLLLLGVLQGVLIALYLLFSKTDNVVRSRALAGFLVILAYDNLETYYFYYLQKPTLLLVLWQYTIPHAAGACLYIYASSHWRTTWPRSLWQYFIPFFFIIFCRAIVVLLSIQGIGCSIDGLCIFLDAFEYLFDPLLIIHIGFFVGKIILEYKQATIEEYLAQWVRVFILVIVSTVVLISILLLLTRIYTDEGFLDIVFSIGVLLSIIIYWLALFSYNKTKVIVLNSQKNEQLFWSKLTEAEINTCLQKLERAFQKDKHHLDSSLNLTKLSKILDVSPKTISAVLNNKLGVGFNEYINTLRVEEVKKNLVDPAKSHLSITGIGLEFGFNSVATFQRVFKQKTGLSPREYIEKSMLKSRIE